MHSLYPSNSGDDYKYSMLSYLDNIVSSSETVFIMGDFNLPDTCWSLLTGSSSFSHSFCDFVYKHNLAQPITTPTHIKGNILDLVLTNSTDYISNLDIKPSHPLICSDHHIISFDVRYVLPPVQSPKAHYVFDYSKAVFSSLSDFLLQSDFSNCYQSNDIEYVWTIIKQSILKTMQLFIQKYEYNQSSPLNGSIQKYDICSNVFLH